MIQDEGTETHVQKARSEPWRQKHHFYRLVYEFYIVLLFVYKILQGFIIIQKKAAFLNGG